MNENPLHSFMFSEPEQCNKDNEQHVISIYCNSVHFVQIHYTGRKNFTIRKNLQVIGVLAQSLNHPVCSTGVINHCLSDLQVTGQ